MRLEGSPGQLGSSGASEEGLLAVLGTRLLGKLIFEAGCFECNRMSIIPQGAFAACQVHKNIDLSYSVKYQEERNTDHKDSEFSIKNLEEGRELTPLKYNSKLMNSIWGLYNRYSVHNFKKIGANDGRLLAEALGALPVEADGPAARIIGTSGAGH